MQGERGEDEKRKQEGVGKEAPRERGLAEDRSPAEGLHGEGARAAAAEVQGSGDRRDDLERPGARAIPGQRVAGNTEGGAEGRER